MTTERDLVDRILSELLATRREIGELAVLPEMVADYRRELDGKASRQDLLAFRSQVIERITSAETKLQALSAITDRLQIEEAHKTGRSEGRVWAVRIVAAVTIGLASWASPALTKGLIPPAIKIAVALQEISHE